MRGLCFDSGSWKMTFEEWQKAPSDSDLFGIRAWRIMTCAPSTSYSLLAKGNDQLLIEDVLLPQNLSIKFERWGPWALNVCASRVTFELSTASNRTPFSRGVFNHSLKMNDDQKPLCAEINEFIQRCSAIYSRGTESARKPLMFRDSLVC